MTKISTTRVHDAISLLVEQHEQINALFERTLQASGNARDQAYFELRRLIAMHETAEQEVIHPSVREVMPAGREIANRSEHEERAISEALQALEKLDIDSEEFTSRLGALRNDAVAHAEHEEQHEFPILGDRLDGAQLVLLASLLQHAEQVAPTPPQPTAEGRAAKLIGDSFSTMVDRVRASVRREN